MSATHPNAVAASDEHVHDDHGHKQSFVERWLFFAQARHLVTLYY